MRRCQLTACSSKELLLSCAADAAVTTMPDVAAWMRYRELQSPARDNFTTLRWAALHTKSYFVSLHCSVPAYRDCSAASSSCCPGLRQLMRCVRLSQNAGAQPTRPLCTQLAGQPSDALHICGLCRRYPQERGEVMSSMRHLRGMLGNCYRAAHGVADRIAKLKVSCHP